jgi:ABC-type multidrug transport system fused ATPase/permease subunit
MVMTAHFFRGSVFLLVNVPLISKIFLGSNSKTFFELFDQAIVNSWKVSIKLFGNILVIPAFLFLSLITGLLITPLERLISCLVSKIAEKIIAIFREPTLFHGTEAMSTEYSEQLSWFFSNLDKKLHWEWELFHYYVYWGIFLNIFLFSISIIILLWSELRWFHYIILPVLVIFYAAFAIARSSVMGKVHMFYSKEYKKNNA